MHHKKLEGSGYEIDALLLFMVSMFATHSYCYSCYSSVFVNVFTLPDKHISNQFEMHSWCSHVSELNCIYFSNFQFDHGEFTCVSQVEGVPSLGRLSLIQKKFLIIESCTVYLTIAYTATVCMYSNNWCQKYLTSVIFVKCYCSLKLYSKIKSNITEMNMFKSY